ncbi:OPT family small oligopeptide transporter [Candida albicans P76067]
MDKIRAVISGGEKPPVDTDNDHNTDFEADRKMPDLDIVVSKSQEFDPVTSHLVNDIMEDEYAAVHVEDDSPYPEVRAAVPSTDDPTLPQNTIRAWVIGLILTTVGCGMNMLFSFHSPSFAITTFVTSILAWPIGNFWAWIVPDWKIFGASLNPGPFNVKEHTIITIMANVSFGTGAAYATDILLAQNMFYKSNFGWGYNLLLIWSTQCIGFAFGGVMRRFVVDSPGAIWPSNLVTATFLTNMHINENHTANGWKISRLAFFVIVFVASFVWYWFPGYIFQALSYFSWITWIKPNNVIINQVFGSSSGLGMIPNNIALDWNQIAGYIGSPLIPPASVIATIFGSIVVIFWIVVPAIHYSNTWYSQYLPISSTGSFDRFQQTYNVSKIIDHKTLSFNEAEYKKYSPLFLSTTFAISYGLSFASILATITHTICFHGRDLIASLKAKEKPDVHNRLMKAYKPVPEWWYLVVFLVFFGMSIATVRAWPTEMPVWGLVFALIIAIIFLLPVAIIYAKTNIAVGLNVVTEFIVGFVLGGRPLCMMLFKACIRICRS